MRIDHTPLIRRLAGIDDFEEWKAELTASMDFSRGRSQWIYQGERLRATGYDVVQWIGMTQAQRDQAIETLTAIEAPPSEPAVTVPKQSTNARVLLGVGALVLGGGAVLTLFGAIAWLVWRAIGA